MMLKINESKALDESGSFPSSMEQSLVSNKNSMADKVKDHKAIKKIRRLASCRPEKTSIADFFISFSMGNMFQHIRETRTRPWDDIELDAIDGLKFISFIGTTVGNTAFLFFFASFISPWSAFILLQDPGNTPGMNMYNFLEVFMFLSAFL